MTSRGGGGGTRAGGERSRDRGGGGPGSSRRGRELSCGGPGGGKGRGVVGAGWEGVARRMRVQRLQGGPDGAEPAEGGVTEDDEAGADVERDEAKAEAGQVAHAL